MKEEKYVVTILSSEVCEVKTKVVVSALSIDEAIRIASSGDSIVLNSEKSDESVLLTSKQKFLIEHADEFLPGDVWQENVENLDSYETIKIDDNVVILD